MKALIVTASRVFDYVSKHYSACRARKERISERICIYIQKYSWYRKACAVFHMYLYRAHRYYACTAYKIGIRKTGEVVVAETIRHEKEGRKGNGGETKSPNFHFVFSLSLSLSVPASLILAS